MRQLLGSSPSSIQLNDYLATFCEDVTPEVKSYSDAIYFNYYALGMSLLFVPVNGYTPKKGAKLGELKVDDLILDGIDFYNVPPNKKTEGNDKSRTSVRSSELAFANHPTSPLVLSFPPSSTESSRPPELQVFPNTTGKEFVAYFGEPSRKGGGAGPSSGSIGIWCEWSRDGVMVEFGGDEAKGPQAWDRGKDANWRVITVFRPKSD